MVAVVRVGGSVLKPHGQVRIGADEGIARQSLAALNALKQKRIGAVRDLQIGADRSLHVGHDLAVDRDHIALRAQRLYFFDRERVARLSEPARGLSLACRGCSHLYQSNQKLGVT